MFVRIDRRGFVGGVVTGVVAVIIGGDKPAEADSNIGHMRMLPADDWLWRTVTGYKEGEYTYYFAVSKATVGGHRHWQYATHKEWKDWLCRDIK